MALEKYQSEFTAEDFENAIRAVPNIGDNGNWFIGDKDTGVFAGGVKITGAASVGQTIVVRSVDDTGRPTSWEPSDLVKKTKIITVLDVTLEKDLVIATDDTDDLSFGDAVILHRHFFYKTPEGNQLKAKRIWGYINPSVEFSTSGIRLSAYYADGTPNSWNFGDVANHMGFADLGINNGTVKANQYWVFAASADLKMMHAYTIGNLGWRANGGSYALTYSAINNIYPYISGIKISNTSSNTFPAGTRIVISAEVEDDA